MAIRINLLAEAQAAEELRRRDPVKRAIFAGAAFVALALIWSGMAEINEVLATERLTGVQTAIETRTNEYDRVMEDQKKVGAIKIKLAALEKLSASRFLQGTLLNALQQTLVDGVALDKFRIEQDYFAGDAGTAPQTNGDHVISGRPPTTKERIVLTIDARDFSSNPGDQVDKFKQAIAKQDYFKTVLDKTNGVQLANPPSPPQNGPDGKPYVSFTLECRYMEHTR
jgi:hypothetical protein